jgi:IPT/TIG domain
MNHAPPPKLPPYRPPAVRRPAVRRPRAASPVVLNVGDQVSINGQVYIVGPGLVPVGAAPTPAPIPTPTPAPPTIKGYRSPAGTAVTTAAPGSPLVIAGQGFGSLADPAAGLVTIGGAAAIVSVWSDTGITLTVPAALPAGPALVAIYQNAVDPATTHTFWKLLASDNSLTIAPGPAPTPGPAPLPTAAVTISAYQDAAGNPVKVGFPNETVTILGQGFGATPASVLWNGQAMPIVSWTDTKIQFTLDVAAPPAGAVTVQTTAGGWYSGLAFPVAPP